MMMSIPISISQVTISTPPPSPPPSSSERHLQMAPALKEKTLKVSLWHFIWNWVETSSFDIMCDTSFYTVSDFPKSVYCQSECDLLMDGLLHFQLKPHNANPATRRAIFSLATWQIADIHKNCANTCNCPTIFVQIRAIVCEYETHGNPEIANLFPDVARRLKNNEETTWEPLRRHWKKSFHNPE